MTEPIVVSYSELDCYRQCPLKHYLAYRQRWTKPAEPGGALSRGIDWHRVMEAHYQHLKDMQDPVHPHNNWDKGYGQTRELAAKAWIRTQLQPMFAGENGKQTEQEALIEWMYDGYVSQWGLDRPWRIVAIEWAPTVDLPAPEGATDQRTYRVKMKIDLVVRDVSTQGRGLLWIVDHKSARDLSNPGEIQLDDQFGIYTWGARQLGKPVAGSLYNGARTYRTQKPQHGFDRHLRYPMDRTDVELTNLALDAWRVAHIMHTTDEVYSSPNPKTCSWKCDYRESHILMRKGMDPFRTLADHGFERNPERH